MPEEMKKVSITGPRTVLKETIDSLWELGVLDIDEYSGELDSIDSFEEADELSELLVDIRSLLSKMEEPEQVDKEEAEIGEVKDSIDRIREKIDDIDSEQSKVESRKESIKEKIGFFEGLKGCGLNISDLKGTDRLEVAVGKPDSSLDEEEDEEGYEAFKGEELSAVAYDSSEKDSGEIDSLLEERLSIPDTDLEGSIEEVLDELRSRRDDVERSKRALKGQMEDMCREWYGKLEATEEFLEAKVSKAQAPMNFGATEHAFIAEGWIPSGRIDEVKEKLAEDTEGDIHIEVEETEEEPPVKHDNPGPVEPFESLTDLMSVPSYREIDPSFVLMLTFPVFFGFMIGDAGYGITTLAVFYGGYRLFPQAADIFKSLMYASFWTLAFGLYFSEAFGKEIMFFGKESILTELTGLSMFQALPAFSKAHAETTLFGLSQEPISSWTVIFGASVLLGVLHVNFGYLLGAVNEYRRHGIVAAVLEKLSWITLQIGIGAAVFGFTAPGLAVAAASVLMLYMGEGVEGVVEIPSLASNILSYLRLFGVAVAALSLAKVVNALAAPLFASGSLAGTVAGVFVLVLGHTFNTFIKIMEGFLQGIRLHYVEMFGKFYEGGGRIYSPFGGDRSF